MKLKMNKESQSRNPNVARGFLDGGTILIAIALFMPVPVLSQAAAQTAAPVAKAKAFDTPKQATDALISAAESFDVTALEQIFGAQGHDIVVTGESARDKERATKFAALAREKERITIDPKDHNRATLIVGPEDWPLPVPIVRTGGKWFFDAKAGRQEILFERIGENELTAIEICRGYVEAQHEYALEKHDDSGVNQYAKRIVSTPGKQDGLAWKDPDGTWGGPVGEEIAQVIEQGYNAGEPFHGYYFKVLKGQGPDAPMGEMDFLVEGAMIGGFALIAAPAQYGVTGVKTFIVSHDGIVYEKDLGPGTLETAKTIERYNPDKSWKPIREP